MKILIVEDNQDILSALAEGFRSSGFTVDTCEDGAKGWELSQVNDYDVIVLDINLPNKSGFEILEKIREEDSGTPIIALTARDSIDDKLTGFAGGFDDYVTKPFVFAELKARVNAVIRRAKPNSDLSLSYGKIKLNPDSREVTIANNPIELTKIEFNILEYLLRKLGQVVPSEELIEKIWGEDSDLIDPPIRSHIKNLRKKLDDTDFQIVKTIPGVGYKIG